MGCLFNPYENAFIDDVYEYYISLNQESFSKACDIELERVMTECAKGQKIIKMI